MYEVNSSQAMKGSEWQINTVGVTDIVNKWPPFVAYNIYANDQSRELSIQLQS